MKIRTQRTSACVESDSLLKLQFSKLTPKKFVESAHTKPQRSMIGICCGIHLSFTMSSMLCVHGVNQRFYLATFARFYLSSPNFNTYIQYHMELRYDRTLAWTPSYRSKIATRPETQITHTRGGRQKFTTFDLLLVQRRLEARWRMERRTIVCYLGGIWRRLEQLERITAVFLRWVNLAAW